MAFGYRAVDVGAGTGKATAPFAERGLRILALEPSAEMAEIARANLGGYEGVTIEEVEFERWQPPRWFRLLFSGQAWHWIEPEFRYTRAREALVPGGSLAVFWNRPRWESNPWRDELSAAYGRTAPDLGAGSAGPGPMHPGVYETPAWSGDWTRELGDADGFEPPELRTYAWVEDYTSSEYVALLQTHSDHILLPGSAREGLLDEVASVTDGHGGTLRLEYVTALWLARVCGGAG